MHDVQERIIIENIVEVLLSQVLLIKTVLISLEAEFQTRLRYFVSSLRKVLIVY